jgi:xylose isomerase
VKERYSSFDSGYGKQIEKGSIGFKGLEQLVLSKLGEPVPKSGRQEYLENLLNRYLT